MEKSKRISIEQAKSIVDKLGIQNYVYPETGRNNWVFLTTNLCLSIPKDCSKIQYATRAAAMQHLTKYGIPTTRLVNYNQIDGIEYIITERITGGPINLGELNAQDIQYIHEQSARMIKSLHSTTATGYGRLNSRLEGTHKTWKEFVDNFFDSALSRLYTDAILWNKFGNELEKLYSEGEHFLKNHSNSFLHGDFHLDNMIFSGKICKAIIDLDIVMNGDVHWDLGHYVRTFHGDRKIGKKIFFETYGNIDEDRANYYSMIIWTRKIASQAETRRCALSESVPEMEDIIKWFTS